MENVTQDRTGQDAHEAKDSQETDDYLSRDETARDMDINPKTLNRWMSEGNIPHSAYKEVWINGRLRKRYKKSWVLEKIEQRKQEHIKGDTAGREQGEGGATSATATSRENHVPSIVSLENFNDFFQKYTEVHSHSQNIIQQNAQELEKQRKSNYTKTGIIFVLLLISGFLAYRTYETNILKTDVHTEYERQIKKVERKYKEKLRQREGAFDKQLDTMQKSYEKSAKAYDIKLEQKERTIAMLDQELKAKDQINNIN